MILFYLSVRGNSLDPPHEKPSWAGIAPGHILASIADVPDYRWLTNGASGVYSVGRRSLTEPAWPTGGLRLSELLKLKNKRLWVNAYVKMSIQEREYGDLRPCLGEVEEPR